MVNTESWKFPTSPGELPDYVNFYDPKLWYFLAAIMSPVMCDLICRLEYKTKFMSNFFGSGYLACLTFSFFQFFVITLLRFYLFTQLVAGQPKFETPFNDLLLKVETVLWVIGTILVVASTIRLGWIGTWHADYFGILFDEKLTGFPFNVCSHPMYNGSKINYIAYIIGNRTVVGLLLYPLLLIVYVITETIEGSFTDMIYAEAAAKSKKGKKSK